jgi:DNA-binding transcriptional regulator YhcF (GntR family)
MEETISCNLLDPNHLRVDSGRPLPRHQEGDVFLQGPIAYDWAILACRLPGVGFHVAMAYRFHAKRFALPGGRHWGIRDIARGLQVSPPTARRGLQVAEGAGLLSVIRKPGCKPRVSPRELPKSKPSSPHRPLYGPIPWRWWLPASLLPGKSLQVAAVCWLLAGWGQSADFELAVEDWTEFGLNRFSVARGLNNLERAGLVSIDRRSGQSPRVSILDRPREAVA